MKHKNVKKSLSLLACLSLMCALLLMCSGCGNKDKEALLGDWEATIDMTDMLNDEMKASLGSDADMMSYFTISSFSLKLNLSFNDDNTYRLSADETELEKSVDQIIDVFRTGVTKYLEDEIANQGVEMTVDELLAEMDLTMDDFMEQMFDKDDIMSSMDTMASEGTFEAKGGILYLTDDDGTGLEAYEVDGDKLTLTGEGVDDGDLVGLYPLVFTKK